MGGNLLCNTYLFYLPFSWVPYRLTFWPMVVEQERGYSALSDWRSTVLFFKKNYCPALVLVQCGTIIFLKNQDLGKRQTHHIVFLEAQELCLFTVPANWLWISVILGVGPSFKIDSQKLVSCLDLDTLALGGFNLKKVIQTLFQYLFASAKHFHIN